MSEQALSPATASDASDASDAATSAASAETPTRRKRVPLRKRPGPCPSCDAELDASLSSDQEPHCPHCGQHLQPIRVAGFWRRSVAATIDLSLLMVTAGPLAWGLNRLLDLSPIAGDALGLERLFALATADFGLVLMRLGPLLLFISIYFLLWSAFSAQTPGHKLLSLRIIDRYGEPPSLLAVGVRTLAMGVGSLAAALGPLWIVCDSEKRALHDHVAGTYVIRTS